MQKNILVAIDGTPCSENAACTAFALAHRMGAIVMLVMVVKTPSENSSSAAKKYFAEQQKAANKLLQRWVKLGIEGWEVDTEAVLLEGQHIAEEIVTYAESKPFDLLLIGTHGRQGYEKVLLGSVAEQVARLSSIPLIVARRKDTDPRWKLEDEAKGVCHV